MLHHRFHAHAQLGRRLFRREQWLIRQGAVSHAFAPLIGNYRMNINE
jgi:hypothetical protein